MNHVKPADRKFVLVKGDAKDMIIEEVKEEKTKEKTAADFDMAKGSAGAAMTVPIRGGEVRKGSHVMLKGHPCKVVEVSISKTGKPVLQATYRNRRVHRKEVCRDLSHVSQHDLSRYVQR